MFWGILSYNISAASKRIHLVFWILEINLVSPKVKSGVIVISSPVTLKIPFFKLIVAISRVSFAIPTGTLAIPLNAEATSFSVTTFGSIGIFLALYVHISFNLILTTFM